MAYDARQQKRLEEAYIEMLQVTGRAVHWSNRVHPRMSIEPKLLPDMPSPDEQTRVRALVGSYGSPEVRKLLGEFDDLIDAIRSVAERITSIRTHPLAEMKPDIHVEL